VKRAQQHGSGALASRNVRGGHNREREEGQDNPFCLCTNDLIDCGRKRSASTWLNNLLLHN
jgi:hypothetical protein